jgi:hypothetical protein
VENNGRRYIKTMQKSTKSPKHSELSPSILIWNGWKEKIQKQTKTGNKNQTQHSAKQMTQSKLFNPNTFSIENSTFGDNIKAHSDIECIIFHNINGIKDLDNWTQINMTMKDMNATIWLCRNQHHLLWTAYPEMDKHHAQDIQSQ